MWPKYLYPGKYTDFEIIVDSGFESGLSKTLLNNDLEKIQRGI